ncbi:hypothetical protein TXYLGN1_05730 [Tepidimicrobium xylanilyticum]
MTYKINIKRKVVINVREFKVIEIKESVFEDNNRQADLLREELKKK